MIYNEADLLYNANISYNGNLNVTVQSFGAKVRIIAQQTKTLSAQSNIQYNRTTPIFTAQSRILAQQTRTLSTRSRLKKTINQSIGAHSFIRGYQLKTLVAKANIQVTYHFTAKGRVNPTISGRVRILRYQGWPIVETEDPGYFLFTDTRLYSRANIYRYLAQPTYLLRALGRVTYAKTLEMTAKARINTGQKLSIRANILPRFFSTHVTAQFSIQRVVSSSVRMVFYMQGLYTGQTLTAKARIVKTSQTRVTGHFMVPTQPVLINNILSIDDPVTMARSKQTLSLRARIV